MSFESADPRGYDAVKIWPGPLSCRGTGRRASRAQKYESDRKKIRKIRRTNFPTMANDYLHSPHTPVGGQHKQPSVNSSWRRLEAEKHL